MRRAPLQTLRPTALIFVCTTCVRDSPPAARSQGSLLAEALRTATTADASEVREVACLNGCRSPCNVSLRGTRRWTYRFSRCTLAEVDALVAAARRYWSTIDGALDVARLPECLRDRLSVCTPPPPLTPHLPAPRLPARRRNP